ncbi:hypothetical protein D3C77_665220 [compost metagenome]
MPGKHRARVAPVAHRFIERGLQLGQPPRFLAAAQHALQQPGALRQLGIEQLLDLVAGVAVALLGNQGQTQGQGAQDQHQGAGADRQLQHFSTR